MNYSRSLNKREIAKRVLFSWAAIALVSGAVGGGIGYGICACMPAKDRQGTVERLSEENAAESKFEDQAVQFEIQTFLRMAKITDDVEKKAEYLECCKQLLKERRY